MMHNRVPAHFFRVRSSVFTALAALVLAALWVAGTPREVGATEWNEHFPCKVLSVVTNVEGQVTSAVVTVEAGSPRRDAWVNWLPQASGSRTGFSMSLPRGDDTATVASVTADSATLTIDHPATLSWKPAAEGRAMLWYR